MSERTATHHEKSAESPLANHEAKAKSQELLENARHEAERSSDHDKEKLDALRGEVDKHTEKPNESIDNKSDEPTDTVNTYWYSREYRDLSFNQFMTKVRGHLGRREKLASKVFHQPAVERLSEIGSKTVARPSGVLVGSIASFVTSLLTYIFAKRYGYDMSYIIFIVSFVGGFVLGIAGEFVYRATRALLARD